MRDRLIELLPATYRQRDAEMNGVLEALLDVIDEQVEIVEGDIEQLYENWFIETCQDWVVPYIGELIGYRPVPEAGHLRFPRRDVANTIAARRRRGTLAAAARLGADAAGLPARAVEFYALVGLTQAVAHADLRRGRVVDLREGDGLDRLGGAFETIAHVVDMRRLTVRSAAGRFNLPSIGLYVWTIRSYSVTMRQPYNQEQEGPECYTFSVLGNDAPLYTAPRGPGRDQIVDDELEAPTPIRRRQFERRLAELYGEGRSVAIWRAERRADGEIERALVPREQIVVANLEDWAYRTPRGKVAVDPVLGRIAFPSYSAELPRYGVWVTYHYGFTADVGGGEYARTTTDPTTETRLYQVGERAPYRRIRQALDRWAQDAPRRAIIEITDSAVYVEQFVVRLKAGQALELRAADGSAPVLRLLDWQTDQPDHLTVSGAEGTCFVLDGILVAGRGMRVTEALDRLIVRHCTLVPGWSLQPDCEPNRPNEASLELEEVDTRVTIDHSIVGTIQVRHDEVLSDPVPIEIRDSIIDATSTDREAIGAPGRRFAHATLDLLRSTVFGRVEVHTIRLAEDSILAGLVRVARRQLGCMRFCWVEPPSRTPRRYRCQPDLVLEGVEDERLRERETLRVQPEFTSVRYGRPGYARLAPTAADEIRRGASDEAEMGVFHDLFLPPRLANAQRRLEEFTPASADAAVIIANEEPT